MIHKFKVEPIENAPVCARVMIDEKPIRCRGYKIEHHVAELPTVELEVLAIPQCEMDAIVEITNKEEIASLMDKEEFEKFCEIWGTIHNEKSKKRDLLNEIETRCANDGFKNYKPKRD